MQILSRRLADTPRWLTRLATMALAVFSAGCFLLSAASAASAAPTFTNTSFESVPLASGLDLPTDVAWAPDGRMFIAEKEGYVRVVEPDGTLLPDPIVDIHDHVIPSGDRGLIGIAVAPASGSDIRLYLLYDHGSPVGTSEATVATATLTWVTVHADNTVAGGTVDPTETTVLGSVNSPGTSYGSACASENIDCIPADGGTHSIGTVIVDPKDGSLWLGSGDGANDFAEENPSPSMLHLRAQDPESLAGKILHVHPDGTGYPDSPFCPSDADLDDNCTKVWGEGFRNPFRFTLRQVHGESLPVVGDVGEGNWEKLDLLDSRGFNAGWPCYEGNLANPDFAKTTQCEALGSAYNRPLFVYTHYSDECTYPNNPPPCDQEQDQLDAAIAAATVYEGSSYPAEDAGKLFIADYVHGWISAINMAEPPPYGEADGTGMPLFAQHLGELVDVTEAPNGDLVYVTLSVNSETALGFGTVREIRYAPNGKSPVAVASSASSCLDSSTSPRQVGFIGDGSYDPDGDTPLTYHWDFGDGSSSNEANPVHTYSTDGNYEARLTVTDTNGNSASGFLAVHIHAGQGEQPVGEIEFPEPSREYIAGKGVQLSGADATPGAESQWQVVKYEGKDILGAMPPFETGTEGSTEFQTDTSPTPTTNYMLHFVVSNGTCTTTHSRILEPQLGQLTLSAQDTSGDPLAVPLTFGTDGPSPSPLQLTVVKNMLATVAAPQTFTSGENTYEFSGWSDGGAREHSTHLFEYPSHAAEETQSLTATYTKVLPPSNGPPTTEPIVGPLPSELVRPQTAPIAPPRVTMKSLEHRPRTLQGTASDAAGMKTVTLALRPQHVKGRGCLWWSTRHRRLQPTTQSCSRPRWLTARLSGSGGVVRWSLPLGAPLPKGRYLLLLRAVDLDGRVSTRFEGNPSGLLVVR